MGCRIRAVSDDESGGAVSNGSMTEALLFTTMCIIGLPVEVHIKDGSVYSGIFHTASVENGYGVVLKKARMTKKGKNRANVANGDLIETLVVLPGDLVQVVAKRVLLPSDGVIGNVAGDNADALACTLACPEKETKTTRSSMFALGGKHFDQKRRSTPNDSGLFNGLTNTSNEGNLPSKFEKVQEEEKMAMNILMNGPSTVSRTRDGIHTAKSEEISVIPVNGRQAGDDGSHGDQDGREKFEFHEKETTLEVQSSGSSSDGCVNRTKPPEEVHSETISEPITDAICCENPASSSVKPDNRFDERPISAGTTLLDAIFSSVPSSAVYATSESGLSKSAPPTEMVLPHNSVSNRSAKEFKLNPEAKVFSPSFINPRSASPPATSTVASLTHIPNNPPVVQVASAQPELGISLFAPRPSLPVKFVPYSNLTAGNAGSGSQYSQPIVGHVGSRTQPVRYAGQYHPVQTGPTYVHPNSQAVMVGRLGQVFYVHPVSHDVVHGAAAVAPVTARPVFTPHQIPFPKQQGIQATHALQLCMPPTLVAGGQQPVVVPSQNPLLQSPFPPHRPMPFPTSNGLYTTKFP